jgi:cytochrome c5
MMLLASLVALTTLPAGSATAANPEADRELVRTYIAAYSAGRLAELHAKIPAWARKYNVNCSTCHSPAVPRLNETGEQFKWAGYRMPEEIGEKAEVGKVQNYVAAGAALHYEWEKTDGTPTTTNGFSNPSLAVFYAGPVGRNFSAFLELDHSNDGVERVVHVSGMWGTKKAYGGFRVGQMHYLVEWGLAGFDRSVGINAPLPVDGPLTGGAPFVLGESQIGLEGFYVTGRNRLSAMVLNGVDATGGGTGDPNPRNKDFMITDQLLLDHAGSGIQAMAYFGGIRGLDSSVTANADLKSKFWRIGITANKNFDNLELLGAIIFGRDQDLPLGGQSPFPTAVMKGTGWWLSAQYTFLREKETTITVFGRYERINPNTDITDAANQRLVAGAVVPINLPQYLRWKLEYRRDFPQGGVPKTNNFATELQITF